MIIRLFFVFILILTGITDAVTRTIPDIFPVLIASAAVCRFVQNPALLIPGVPGLFLLSIPMLLFALRKNGIGGGDIKLTAACGLFLGTDALLTGAFLAAILALAVIILRRAFQKLYAGSPFSCQKPARKQPFLHEAFAFGPYLAAGFILASLTV